MARPSVQLYRDAATVEAFLSAGDNYVSVLEPRAADPLGMGIPSLSGMHTWVPRPGYEAQAGQLRAEVAARAGAAAPIVSRAAGMLYIRPGRMTGREPITVNPVESWFNPFEPGSDMQIQTVRDFANQAAGKLRAQADAAAAHESGPIWWIARFIRLPVEVREAGFTSKAGQTAAAGAGVFVQGVAIAVMAGLVLLLFQAIL